MNTTPKNSIQTSRSKTPNKYKLLASTFSANCLYAGSIILIFFDWTADMGWLTFPLSKIIRALLLIVFSTYLLRTGIWFGKFKFPYGGVISFYFFLNLGYSITSSNIEGNLYYSSRIIFWLLISITAYRLILSGSLSEKMLQKMIIITVLIGAIFTIYFMTLPDIEAGQNASAYLLLWCLPFLLMFEKSRLINIALPLAIFAILLTVKRGAMIALGLSLVTYGIMYLRIHGNTKQFLKLIKVVMFLLIISSSAMYTNWDAIQNRFQDTSGSGRDRMYSLLINHWAHSEPTNIIFGFGIQSVQKYTGYLSYGEFGNKSGHYAHSDWIQLTHDFGLLGMGFLIWLHTTTLILILKCYRIRHPITPSLMMGYVILFLVNIYSGHLMAPGALYFGLLLAYSSAQLQKSRN